MSFMKEFREFAVKGSVVDLAVGVIIGAAFNKIVDSLVKDIVMPVLGRFTGGIDFTDMYIALGRIPPDIAPTLEAVRKAGVPVIAYGSFANVVLHFLILALVVFLMVRQINRLRREKEKEPAPPPPAPPEELVVLREIRDAVRAR